MNIIFKPLEGEDNVPHLIEMPEAKEYCREYDSVLELAKANAVPFRKEDRVNIFYLIDTPSIKPDPENIYSIEGKYEIKEECEMCRPDFNCAEYHQENNCSMIQKFAILLKEEIVKEAEKEESQNELWIEVKKSLSTSGLYWLANVMRDFHITRIK